MKRLSEGGEVGALKYKAFISYSHKDQKWANWLHKRLEHYRFPKRTVGQITDIGPVPKSLKPIFKDREELSAAENLGQKIESALSQSETLIVICSPHAAKSHWVNQEIIYFKSRNPEGKVFSIIIGGEPFSQSSSECLPHALRFNVDAKGHITPEPAEPLAADLRPEGDGKRLGFLKLISGMAGLGLDDLVQRDLQRARQRVIAVTTSAASVMLIMGGLTWLAMDARQVAEKRKGQAETLIEYMIGDLKDKLEPVGRVDVLDGVAGKVIDYYNSYEPHEIDCQARSRRAHALHVATEVSYSTSKMEDFSQYANKAYSFTQANFETCEDKETLLFDHAQSAFWKGYVEILQNNAQESQLYLEEYRSIAGQLVALVPENPKYQIELGSANLNIGVQHFVEKEWGKAFESFQKAELIYQPLYNSFPNDLDLLKNYAGALGWIARTNWKDDNPEKAKAFYRKKIDLQMAGITSGQDKDWDLLVLIGSDRRTLARQEVYAANYAEGLAQAKKAEDFLQQATQHDENNIEWRKELAYSQIIMLHILKHQNNDIEYKNVRQRFERTLGTFQDTPNITEATMTRWLKLNPKEKDTP